MNYRPAIWFPIGLLAVLAGLSLWLQYAVHAPAGGANGNSHVVDYIVENFSATRADLTGRPVHTLNARKLQHYLDDDSTVLDFPHFTAVDSKNGRVDIRSNSALVSSEGEKLSFTGKVVLVRDLKDEAGTVTLTTDYLEVFPDQRLVRTDRPVVLQGRRMQINAGGLELNNETRVLRLTRHVKSRYEPAP